MPTNGRYPKLKAVVFAGVVLISISLISGCLTTLMQIRYGIHSPGVGVDGRKEGRAFLASTTLFLASLLIDKKCLLNQKS